MKFEKLPFYNKLDANEREILQDISFVKHYNEDEILFFAGEKSKYLLFLLSGEVKIYKTAARAKEIVLHILKAPCFVAEVAIFEEMEFPASAVFTKSGEILKIDYEKFKANFFCKQEICLELLRSVSKKVCAIEGFVSDSLILSAEQKTAQFLLNNFDKFLKQKKTQTANDLNISQETLSRILANFKKEKILITDKNGKLEIRDAAKLEKILGN